MPIRKPPSNFGKSAFGTILKHSDDKPPGLIYYDVLVPLRWGGTQIIQMKATAEAFYTNDARQLPYNSKVEMECVNGIWTYVRTIVPKDALYRSNPVFGLPEVDIYPESVIDVAGESITINSRTAHIERYGQDADQVEFRGSNDGLTMTSSVVNFLLNKQGSKWNNKKHELGLDDGGFVYKAINKDEESDFYHLLCWKEGPGARYELSTWGANDGDADDDDVKRSGAVAPDDHYHIVDIAKIAEVLGLSVNGNAVELNTQVSSSIPAPQNYRMIAYSVLSGVQEFKYDTFYWDFGGNTPDDKDDFRYDIDVLRNGVTVTDRAQIEAMTKDDSALSYNLANDFYQYASSVKLVSSRNGIGTLESDMVFNDDEYWNTSKPAYMHLVRQKLTEEEKRFLLIQGAAGILAPLVILAGPALLPSLAAAPGLFSVGGFSILTSAWTGASGVVVIFGSLGFVSIGAIGTTGVITGTGVVAIGLTGIIASMSAAGIAVKLVDDGSLVGPALDISSEVIDSVEIAGSRIRTILPGVGNSDWAYAIRVAITLKEEYRYVQK